MARHAAMSAVAGVAAALLALTWTGSMEADVGPGRVQLSSGLHLGGGTVVELPPLGQLSASTHAAPMRLKATVLAVDVDAVQLTARGDDPIALLESSITKDLAPALRWFAWRTLALSALAGA